jgi:hypothetical protein
VHASNGTKADTSPTFTDPDDSQKTAGDNIPEFDAAMAISAGNIDGRGAVALFFCRSLPDIYRLALYDSFLFFPVISCDLSNFPPDTTAVPHWLWCPYFSDRDPYFVSYDYHYPIGYLKCSVSFQAT